MFIPLYSLFNYVRAVTGSLKIMLISIIVMCSKEQCLICSSKFHRCCVIMEITTKKNIKPEAYKNAALTWLPNVKTHEFQACDLKSILKQNPRKELPLSFIYNTYNWPIGNTEMSSDLYDFMTYEYIFWIHTWVFLQLWHFNFPGVDFSLKHVSTYFYFELLKWQKSD